MKRVFFVTSNLAKGGAERVTSVLAGFLARDACLVTIVYMKDDATVYPLEEGIERVFCFGKGGKLRRISGKILQLRSLMKQNKGATFVAMLPFETVYTWLAGTGLRVKKVYSLRNDPGKMNRPIDRLINRLIYPHADRVVFQTRDAMNYFPENVRKRGCVIPNPLSGGLPEPYEGERSREFVSVGRLEVQKNYPLLLRAFRRVHELYPEWKLRIFGKGSLESELKSLSEKFGISNSVVFEGFADNVVERINKSGCFVLASDFEGISNAMLEALATGVPCICTDCPPGGARMFIESGINGFLTPVGDESALSDAMLWMIQHPQEAHSMARQALSIREKLAPECIVLAWKDVIE